MAATQNFHSKTQEEISMTREEFQECFLGNIIFYNKTENFHAENRKKGELKRFINMLLKQKKLPYCLNLADMEQQEKDWKVSQHSC